MALWLLLGLAAGGSALAQDCRAAVPTQFPIDSYVFAATVLEPVLLDAEDEVPGDVSLTRVEVTAARHLPVTRRTFDLALHDATCLGLSRADLIDRFMSGDQIHVVAYRRGEAESTLEAPADWVRLADESLPRGMNTAFEYFVALLKLDTLSDDSKRSGILRSMATFIEDPELYRRLLDAQLQRKSLRKQLRQVHALLHRDPQ